MKEKFRQMVESHWKAFFTVLQGDLKEFEQKTHVHVMLRDPLADALDALSAAFWDPTALTISNLDQAITRYLTNPEAQ